MEPTRPRLPLEIRGRAVLARIQAHADQSRLGRWGFEFLMFGLKQGWACMFGGIMVALLFATARLWPHAASLARYDFLVIAAVTVQLGMLTFRLESLAEARVIFLFHLVGTVMEVFKTRVGSWEYPEPSLLRIAGVPLFSGFMYASVGSYIARIMRIFDIRFSNYPRVWTTWCLAGAIYANFFLNHWILDLRPVLFAATALLFWKAWFWFTPDRRERAMPVLLGFLLVAVFIWLAENLGTYTRAWIYPAQRHGWTPVSMSKIGSWYLLMIISWVLVSLVFRPETRVRAAPGRSTT